MSKDMAMKVDGDKGRREAAGGKERREDGDMEKRRVAGKGRREDGDMGRRGDGDKARRVASDTKWRLIDRN